MRALIIIPKQTHTFVLVYKNQIKPHFTCSLCLIMFWFLSHLYNQLDRFTGDESYDIINYNIIDRFAVIRKVFLRLWLKWLKLCKTALRTRLSTSLIWATSRPPPRLLNLDRGQLTERFSRSRPNFFHAMHYSEVQVDRSTHVKLASTKNSTQTH